MTPQDPHGHDDSLDALDDYAPGAGAQGGNQQDVDDLDVLDAYTPAHSEPTASNLDEAVDSLTEVETSDGDKSVESVQVFTASNPTGTVSVSAFLGGGICNVDLLPEAINMPAAQLAEEIIVIADLAKRKGASAQHTLMLEQFAGGQEDMAVISGFLTHDLKLPTPQQAAAEEAELFATRYPRNDG